MRKKKTVIFSLLDTLHYSQADRNLFSHLYSLLHQGYDIVLATNNTTAEKEILSKLTAREKKKFHVILAPYHLDAKGNWKGLFKFSFIVPTAYIWCDITLKHLKKEYDEVICLWAGFSDRVVFSSAAKKHKCKLIWIETLALETQFNKLKIFSRFIYNFAQKYPDHIISTSSPTVKSLLKNSKFTKKQITLLQEQGKESFNRSKDQSKKIIFSVIEKIGKK